jgi:hypothetical protein
MYDVFRGVWVLRVTGPEALVSEAGELTVEVEGRFGPGADKYDRSNLIYAGSEAVARLLGRKSYDDMPERFTQVAFSEPELGANEHVTSDGTQQWFVGVYAVGRAYGGPEEGGWWFDTGELVQQTAVSSLAEAEELRASLVERFHNTGKASGVLGGDDYRIAVDIRPHPAEFPESVPHYE